MIGAKEMTGLLERYDRFLVDYAVAVLRLIRDDSYLQERRIVDFLKGTMFNVSVEKIIEYLSDYSSPESCRDKIVETIWGRQLVMMDIIEFIGKEADRQTVFRPLIKMLKNEQHPDRPFALATLCCFDFPDAVSSLALEFPKYESPMRWVALVQLKKRWDDNFIPVFLKALLDQDPEVIRIAIIALSKSSELPVLTHIKKLLYHGSEKVVLAAINAIVDMNDTKSMLDLRDLFRKSDSAKIRSTIVSAIGRLNSNESVEFLSSALEAPESRVRANAVDALNLIGKNKGLLPESVLTKIRKMLNDLDHRVRADAIKALWELGQSENLSEIESMIKSNEEMVRASGAYLCGKLKLLQFSKNLELMTGDISWNVRKMAALALLGLGRSGKATLESLIEYGTPDQQVIAAYALGLSDDPAGIETLISQSQSGSEMADMATRLLLNLS